MFRRWQHQSRARNPIICIIQETMWRKCEGVCAPGYRLHLRLRYVIYLLFFVLSCDIDPSRYWKIRMPFCFRFCIHITVKGAWFVTLTLLAHRCLSSKPEAQAPSLFRHQRLEGQFARGRFGLFSRHSSLQKNDISKDGLQPIGWDSVWIILWKVCRCLRNVRFAEPRLQSECKNIVSCVKESTKKVHSTYQYLNFNKLLHWQKL